ncbi:peptidoglycan DD-metalloendopeptidase family protein [Desulforhopalus vacuolatus]|uniref:murein hydrolase activator EnvC family protein n=1 Tax=Desulforhopalus vacuolatus TaxID=40414 RepID=UPI001966AFFA|nr:peptidoglycan DD-metalloendopeptidase family protein [Desulforhopalus vacuolatus]MBM9519582.1 peptidoglycan DD-metalloendopeptidase family protein [Desulforhopalus vacuolatus]
MNSVQQKKPVRNVLRGTAFLFIFAMQGICACVFNTFAMSQEPSVEKQIESYNESILYLEGNIAVARGEDNQFKREEKKILHDILQMDLIVAEHQTKLRKLQASAKKYRTIIRGTEKKLQHLHTEREKAEVMLQKRASVFYRMGRLGLLNAIFSARTLPDLIIFNNAFEQLVTYDSKLLAAYEETLKLQKKNTESFKLQNAALDKLVKQGKGEEVKVAVARKNLEKVLKAVQDKRSLHRKTIQQLEKKSQEITEAISRVKDEITREQKAFLKSKGKLPMPVDGIVRTRFHAWTENKFGEQELCEGIEIEAPDGASVCAIGTGKVIFAGYLEGYGNAVIINHGSHVYTVTARLENVEVEAEKTIRSGTVIGIAGDSTTLFTRGLYFEVRQGNNQVDPLEWIDSEQLKFK